MAIDKSEGDGRRDELIDHDTFMVYDRLWFVAPKERPADTNQIAGMVAKAHTSGGMHPVVFTELGLANDFVNYIGGTGKLKPFTFPSLDDFAEFLNLLLEIGNTRLCFDPGEAKHVRAIPITKVLEGIRNRNP